MAQSRRGARSAAFISADACRRRVAISCSKMSCRERTLSRHRTQSGRSQTRRPESALLGPSGRPQSVTPGADVVGVSFGKAALCSVAAVLATPSLSPPCRHALVRSTLSSRARLAVCAAVDCPVRQLGPLTVAHFWTVAHAPSSSSTGRSTRSTGLSSRGTCCRPPRPVAPSLCASE